VFLFALDDVGVLIRCVFAVWVCVCVCVPADYMMLARRIKRVMHDHGIHSTTIQPEFQDVVCIAALAVCVVVAL